MIMNMRKKDLAMMHAHYDKVIKMDESVAFFAQLDTRKLEQNFVLVPDLLHWYT